jgi:hypothetical protein
MFSTKVGQYLLLFGVVSTISYIATKYNSSVDKTDEYELIKKYLLNDSPLYGFNRPKLWIHSKYELNARKWKDFQSRNTTELNQPYLHLTIKSIINHCGKDFNVCLIDDESFSKLIPSWEHNLVTMAEPMKSHYRELGMAQLLYYYGGMIVPNSFICIKNLKPLYDESVSTNKPFVCENVNHSVNLLKQKNKMLFMPSTFFMGANKNDSVIKALIEHIKGRNKNPYFNTEADFLGDTSYALFDLVNSDFMTLVLGQSIGVKTRNKKQILVDHLMEENYLDLSDDIFGIYIPADEILQRTKYQWFASLSQEEILESNLIVAKYLKASIVNSTDIYSNSTEVKSVVSI